MSKGAHQALYDRIGVGYAALRRPDARLAARIDAALGECRSVLNVGAGAGSYEPADRLVVAVEPSAEMIRQRPGGAAPVVQASANELPFRDRSFDAALAILTVHHWPRRDRGLAEMRRVARERVVIFTWDPAHAGFWLLREYFPEVLELDRPAFPSLREIEMTIGPAIVHPVPVPADCSDGFLGAYWQRPALYLDRHVRDAISVFSKFDSSAGLARLRRDLRDGTWLARHAALHGLRELDVGYRLIVAHCEAR
ncbi:MAG TPA: class I SAM-dependent methyltransferase [Gammaproteobacteria bacterium]|nr:class I SAM-dependent methyltransferase [Gammaproteobacteria bacterium]